MDVAHARLHNQRLSSAGFTKPEDVVSLLGAVQAQDYPGAKWALGLRMRRATDAAIEGDRRQDIWFSASMRTIARPLRTAYLLPLHDEDLIAYKDRSASLDLALWKAIAGRDPFSSPIVLDGRVVGGWKRTLKTGKVAIAFDLPVPLKKTDARLVSDAARRFGAFLGLDVAVGRK